MAITIPQALETFVRGFAFTRSFTHPYLVEQVGPLWVMRDGPRKRGTYRTEEWVSFDMSPAAVVALVQAHCRDRYAICAVVPAADAVEPMRDEFKTLGYRLVTTEPLMVHDLTEIPAFSSSATVERVLSAEVAAQVNKAARKRQILPEHLVAEAPVRQYVAWLDDELVGWVRSIVINERTWCSDMFVKVEFRRRGIGSALLCRLLQDDQLHGTEHAVLLASHTGAKLYASVGYKQLGTLLLFTPRN